MSSSDKQPPSFLENNQTVREYKRYFEEQPNKTPENSKILRLAADLKLNTQGYTTFHEAALDKDATDFEPFDCPEGLVSERITPIRYGWGEAYLVWNPDMAEVYHVVMGTRRNSPMSVHEEQQMLEDKGWEYIDGNVRGISYARRKLDLPPVSVPDDIAQNEELQKYLPHGIKVIA